MYITSNSAIVPNTDIKVVGRVTKVDSPFIYLQYNGNTVKIKYNNLHKYTKNTLIVTGTYNDGVLEEKYVDELDDDFDDKLFYRVVSAMEKYEEVF
ncbi:hypothetical protein THOM_1123 [Trachipleistophora hominis]|uniref:Replication factor A protein 3 n=1 Tax=Trachipleistophora hominis TaxID=72359 RepID=L7JX81_TRAHO|nr:hypothetical protein THOM_1123 [Trachipleistophora hominis]